MNTSYAAGLLAGLGAGAAGIWLALGHTPLALGAAAVATLVESAKANGIDPYRYLIWLFQRLPLAKTVDDYDALLPWKMPAELR